MVVYNVEIYKIISLYSKKKLYIIRNMKEENGKLLFFSNKFRAGFNLFLCFCCVVFSVYVITAMDKFKLLAWAALAFFIYKTAFFIYMVFFDKQPLITLTKDSIIIDGCPALPFKNIEVIGQKRINSGASSLLYVCFKTDEKKFNLTDLQKDNLSAGLTAFCFRPAALSRKDADFIIKEVASKIHQKL